MIRNRLVFLQCSGQEIISVPSEPEELRGIYLCEELYTYMHTINIFFHLHFRYYCRFSTELFHGIKVDKESDKEFFKKLRHEHKKKKHKNKKACPSSEILRLLKFSAPQN